jgi:hypothetical protein
MDTRAVTFEAATHTYRVGGVRVPSVTQVLRPLCNFDGIPTHVLEAKADLGRRVHTATQYLDEDDLDEATITDEAPYLAAWRKFRNDTGAQVVHNELVVVNHDMGYAGTLDRVLSLWGDPWLVDIKTSFTTPLSAGPQTAAYMRALGNPDIRRRAALRLRGDGTYRLDPLDGIDDWSVFVAAMTIHRFKEARRG